MFSPPRGAASCPPCWKPIPVTDSGRRRRSGADAAREEGGGRKGAEGPHGRPGSPAAPGTLGGRGRVSRRRRPRPPPRPPHTAGGRRPSPPPRAGLCNPVAAARPRAGPWGEGRGRLGWGEGGGHEGSGLHRGPARRRPRFPLPGAAGGAGGRAGGRGGEPASERSLEGGGQEARAAAAAFPAGLGGARGFVSGRGGAGGRVGDPAGTRLPGHEFLCHRNLISCQVRSRLRLGGFHLGPFLSSRPFPTPLPPKKKGENNLLTLLPSVFHTTRKLVGRGSECREEGLIRYWRGGTRAVWVPSLTELKWLVREVVAMPGDKTFRGVFQ